MTVANKAKKYYVYIVASDKRTLYTGLVEDLHLAVFRHRTKEIPGSHDPKRLAYHEVFTNRPAARKRANEIKAWTRKKKIELIKSANPGWTFRA
jgi:putative endonuclease